MNVPSKRRWFLVIKWVTYVLAGFSLMLALTSLPALTATDHVSNEAKGGAILPSIILCFVSIPFSLLPSIFVFGGDLLFPSKRRNESAKVFFVSFAFHAILFGQIALAWRK